MHFVEEVEWSLVDGTEIRRCSWVLLSSSFGLSYEEVSCC